MSQRAVKLLLSALVLSTLLGLMAARSWREATRPLEPEAPSIVFSVPQGASLRQVASQLEAQGIIRSARALSLLARLRRLEGSIRAGEYDLSPAQAMPEVLEHLIRGPLKTYEVSLPEGLTAREIGQRLSAAGLVELDSFLHFVYDPTSAPALGVEGPTLEGYLFPETYRLPRGLPAEHVARILVDEFHRNWQALLNTQPPSAMSMREVVTLASIVEKETGAPEERPLIASVFLNRLQRNMRLETDPTVIYGIPDFDGNLTRAHLQDGSNPYNTYKISGLPPGPIASPGLDALRAVLAPAESAYLYFVSMNDGTHHFSATYREHVNAVNRYQRWGRHKKR